MGAAGLKVTRSTARMAKWVLTPSLRVATFSHMNKQGEDVLVDTDLTTKLCRHGETGSTIRNWLQAEAKARAAGMPAPPRPSICDCTSVHGLKNVVVTRPPTPPASVYDVLAASGTKPVEVGEEAEPAFEIGSLGVLLTARGELFCSKHKNRMIPPCAKRVARPFSFKAERDRCACSSRLPKRSWKLSLGRRVSETECETTCVACA